jgi:hypothetical protein
MMRHSGPYLLHRQGWSKCRLLQSLFDDVGPFAVGKKQVYSIAPDRDCRVFFRVVMGLIAVCSITPVLLQLYSTGASGPIYSSTPAVSGGVTPEKG